MSTPSKLAKQAPYIGTHDNTYHCDDVTACYLLKSLSRFKDHDIVRTRDPELLAGAEIIVDVGGELDVERLRLDHHQRSFNQTIKDYHPNLKTTNPTKAVRLSSAGLVYALFGKDYIVSQLKLGSTFDDIKEDDDKKKLVDFVFQSVYLSFIEEIDAIDNGVEITEGDKVVYNYRISSDLSSRVGYTNPYGTDITPELRLDSFKKAMTMVGSELSDRVEWFANTVWPKRQLLRESIKKRKEFDSSGQILFITKEQLFGWKESLLSIEEELGIVGEIKFIVFKDDASGESPWRATCVPIESKSFLCRVPLKAEWRGKRVQDLQKVSGIPEATFVHMTGFTGGALTEAGIKTLVRRSLGLE